MALLPGSKFYGKLTRYPCKSFQEVQARASVQIKWEEDEGRLPERLIEQPKKSEQKQIVLKKIGDAVQWPDKLRIPLDQRDTSKWCKFHNDYGHTTDDCFTLKKEVIQLLSYLRDLLSERGKAVISRAERREEEQKPPLLEKTINVIFSGSEIGEITHSSAKKHVKQTENFEVWNDKPMVQFTRQVISFTDDEMTKLLNPHDDALVITLQIANCEVKRIMIDDGSSVNLLFMSTLQAMRLSEADIIRGPIPLIGFSGEQQFTISSIPLQVYAKGINL
ncbi:uncharacterized protein LOC119998599 [Tripterygium wilfordii]|uniref:uncharacterized protein LOC119998599 n=1 Tax=Tripterygium wilfordii TaxID=458696 RepID=UPI0018F81956|nr:uncharacterized protein LOC119998599 [Tripterygium wilfordii]